MDEAALVEMREARGDAGRDAAAPPLGSAPPRSRSSSVPPGSHSSAMNGPTASSP